MITTILVIIAIVLTVAIGALLLYAATAPDTFLVSRSAVMDAPPEKIFPMINDLHAQSAMVAVREGSEHEARP